ncbi:hypothetical protein NMY22_g4277 [Coprinellus aureogranulatus]|nr:hypothetical protein NMY22_g4277 [Coprinellus aureogranulatus]
MPQTSFPTPGWLIGDPQECRRGNSPLTSPSGTPTYSAYTPIPPALITNVIVASSLNVIYTTCPAVLRTRTHNSDADQVSTMVDNGKQLIPFMISRMDHLVLCMRPVLRDHVYNGVVERLVRCHTHWHDPSLEVQQQFGLDSLLLDRTARRTLITVHRKLVNPWLCYMVDDYREINRRLLFVHHKMNEIHSRLAALHQ